MKELCADFGEYLLKQKSVSGNTFDSYVRDVNFFLEYASKNGICNPAQVDKKFLDGYVVYMKSNNKSCATVVRNIASIRSFYEFLIYKGKSDKNPAKLVKLERQPKKFPEILSGDEIELLLSQPDISESKGCRDKAMLELLYATGIRASELVMLDVGDIHLNAGTLSCSSGKTKRTIPVYPTAVAAVSDYIFRVRSEIITPDGGNALFINLNGKRLTRQGFWKIVKGYAKQAKIVKEITPCTLRHSFALHLLENGAELKDIQAMLGHADISSTQMYVHLLNDHFKEVYNKCHPRAKLG
ncbi:MAG TPA: site-specific tyrosine recombinase XerD [Ruminococcaceae bacterium]|jgi:integrase/recombinase XerD|nr:site-specific tyrosine recombinase XerD [Oscillospiraceae bacterium]